VSQRIHFAVIIDVYTSAANCQKPSLEQFFFLQ
jgi:hypothetical protein